MVESSVVDRLMNHLNMISDIDSQIGLTTSSDLSYDVKGDGSRYLIMMETTKQLIQSMEEEYAIDLTKQTNTKE